MLSWFSSLFGGSYALALLLYALLFKLLFLPFGIKQQKNQIKMAKLAPKIALIKAKYRGRNDQPTLQKQQQEIMDLQQREGYSPLSGCLPLLLQMPIIIFLYKIIQNPLSYICKLSEDGVRAIAKLALENGLSVGKDITLENIASTKIAGINQINLISHINSIGVDSVSSQTGVDLSNLPSFKAFGLDLAANPTFSPFTWLVIIPVIAAALTWLSMWLTRKWNGNGMNPAQDQDPQAQASAKMMDLMMPAMTLFFAFNFSGILGLYWIYQSALGILQTFALSRIMPLPKYTDEEIKEMRKAEKAAEKAQRQALKENPTKYRSLHYIDEDDYEELPSLTEDNSKSQDKKKNVGMDIPDIKD